MALIKKFQNGNTVPDLNANLDIEIRKINMPRDVEAQVRDEVGKIRDFLAQGEGRELIVDDVTGQWEIKGPGAEQFKGSMDKIKSGFLTGRMKPKNIEQMRNIAATIYGAATKKPITNTPTTTPEVSTKPSVSIFTDLGNYTVNEFFGNEANAGMALGEAKDDEARKKLAIEILNKATSDYMQNAGQYGSEADYSDLEKVKAMKAAIDSGNWDDIIKKSYDLKWDVGSLLLSPQDKANIKAEEEQKVAAGKEEQAKLAVQDLINSGVSENVATNLVQGGYTPGSFRSLRIGERDINPQFQEYLKSKNARVYTKGGKRFIFDANGVQIQETGEGFDFFNPLYGLAFTQDESGLTFVPSKFDVSSLEGKELNIEGLGENKAYTFEKGQKIDVRTPEGIKIGEYKRQPDGTYKNQAGDMLPGTIKGLGNTRLITERYNLKQMFPKIQAKQNNISPESALQILESATQFDSNVERAFQNLLFDLQNGKFSFKPALRAQVKDALGYFYQKQFPDKPTSLKNGGVLFAKKGAWAEYKKKFEANISENVSKPLKDVRGTWKDMSSGEKVTSGIGIGSTAMSLAPGVVGATGAAASFGIDLVRDLKDGKVDNWGTHALNAAFVPLSFIGLGGTKLAIKGAKAVDTAVDLAKLTKKATKLAKSSTDGSKAAVEAVETFTKANKELKTLADLKNAAKQAKNAEELSKGINLLEKAANASPKVLGSVRAGALAKSISGSVKSDKVFKGALNATRAAIIIPGVASGVSTVKTGLTEGWEYTKPDQIKRAVMAGVVGTNWIKDIDTLRAIKSQSLKTAGTEGKTTVNLGGQDIELKTDISIPKLKDTKWWKPSTTKKSKITDENEKIVKDFRDKVKKAVKDEGIKLSDEQVKAIDTLTPDKVGKIPEIKGEATYTLGESPQWTGKNPSLDARDYEIAKKYIKVVPKKTAEAKEAVEKVSKVVPKEAKEAVSKVEKTAKAVKKETKKIAEETTKKEKIISSGGTAKKAPKGINPDETGQTKMRMKYKAGGVLKAQRGLTVKYGQGIKNWEWAKKFEDQVKDYVNPTGLANLAMFASTIGTNKRTAKLQKQAALAGITRMSGISPTKINTASVFLPQAEKAAATITSKTGRMAKATTDIDKGNAVQLEGVLRANEAREKGMQMDQQRLDAIKNQQLSEDARVQAFKQQVDTQNKLSLAKAAQSIPLIETNRLIANNTALQNLVHTTVENIPTERYKRASDEYTDLRNGPELKQLADEYKKESSAEKLGELKKQYEAAKSKYAGTTGVFPSFEESDIYKNHQTKLKTMRNQLEVAYDPLNRAGENLQIAQQHYMMRLVKKGGSLTKAERSELQRENAQYKQKLKELELFHKSIMHNNEMLQKALIKVFK